MRNLEDMLMQLFGGNLQEIIPQPNPNAIQQQPSVPIQQQPSASNQPQQPSIPNQPQSSVPIQQQQQQPAPVTSNESLTEPDRENYIGGKIRSLKEDEIANIYRFAADNNITVVDMGVNAEGKIYFIDDQNNMRVK